MTTGACIFSVSLSLSLSRRGCPRASGGPGRRRESEGKTNEVRRGREYPLRVRRKWHRLRALQAAEMPRRAELRRRSGEGRFQESRIREKKGIWNVHDGKGNWKTHQDYYFACGGRIERCEYAPTFMSDFVQSTYRLRLWRLIEEICLETNQRQHDCARWLRVRGLARRVSAPRGWLLPRAWAAQRLARLMSRHAANRAASNRVGTRPSRGDGQGSRALVDKRSFRAPSSRSLRPSSPHWPDLRRRSASSQRSVHSRPRNSFHGVRLR